MTVDHIDSYYARTRTLGADRPPLEGDRETDIAIIGGGLAGLSAALSLIERGHKNVTVIEARKVGWGASGRNGGFVSPGFAKGMNALIRSVGRDKALALYGLTRDAIALVRRRVDRYAIPCEPVDTGMIQGWWTDDAEGAKHDREELNRVLGETWEFWPRERMREALVTHRYYDGLFRKEGFHFHCLNYARGVAQAIEAGGGRIFEQTPARRIERDNKGWSIQTEDGRLRARQAIVACGGYIRDLHPAMSAAIQPVATYVIATEPLGERLKTAIRGNWMIADSRFDFDYYRALPDTRILFGGGIAIWGENPPGMRARMRRRLLAVYPQLADVKIETAWGGTMGYPIHKMPMVGEAEPGLWYTLGYGGHGMGTTAMTGELVAGAIAERDDRYRMLASFSLRGAGGKLGLLGAQALYWYYQGRDRLSDRGPARA
ncbi:MAG: FAD-dependent oxidoreductase [Dongiaceae bacterium]